jgi:hypothetical protein
MGWGSGTQYFDKPLDLFLKYVPEGEREALVYEHYKMIRSEDWDTQDESKYYLDYIIHFDYREGYLDWEEYVERLGYEIEE